MTRSAGGPGQRVPAQVRAAAGDQSHGAGAATLGATRDQAGGGAGTEALEDSEDRIHEATGDRSYEAPACC